MGSVSRAAGQGWNTAIRGRGAVGNPEGRFEVRRCDPFDDGWGTLERTLAASGRPETVVHEERARSILATNESPDIPFDRSINPYRGCEHGCVYCFARPSHAYWGWSPGLDFETQLVAKTNAAERLEATLRRPHYRCRTLALGANTDPYQPIERTERITRDLLEVLARFRHPVAIVTKSAGVLRDLDLLREMATENLVAVYVSVTTLDRDLASKLEPRAATPSRRLSAIRELSAAGVPSGVMASPMIPGLNDHELEAVLEAAADAGARSASYMLLRLPHELKTLFSDWLRVHAPARREKVLSLLRQSKGGRLNDPRFGFRMRGEGPLADLLRARFRRVAKARGLDERIVLREDRFAPPPRPGTQARLF